MNSDRFIITDDDFDLSGTASSAYATHPVSGHIGAATTTAAAAAAAAAGSSQQQQSSSANYYSASASLGYVQNTLDEPVLTTIKRDLLQVWHKIRLVIAPGGQPQNALREWDLWGPLLLCLGLAAIMSVRATSSEHAAGVFTGIFVIVWCGSAVVTLNSKLLGCNISFFQSICVLGYCVFPLFVAATVSLFVPLFFVRLPAALVGLVWSTIAALRFLAGVNLPSRRALVLYPIYLFYFAIFWIIIIT
ncbi:Yip1-domain-containing protein [Ramicandelaber brevisporus]|nr:Yip1-domain-containing protein [Ramicandelaber brevisporus]